MVSYNADCMVALLESVYPMTQGQARRLCKQIQQDNPNLQVHYRHYTEGDYYTLYCEDEYGGKFEICSPEEWENRKQEVRDVEEE